MMVVSRRAASTAALAIAFAVSFAAAAWSQAPAARGTQPITGFQVVTNSVGSAKVTAINPGARMVTLAFSDGRTGSYKVSDTIQIGRLGIGDTIEASYEEWLSFVLSGPDARTPADRDIAGAVRTGPGQVPAGAVANQTVVTWIVVGTDVPANTLSLVNPAGGQVRTFAVKSAAGRAELPRVKPGDRLTAISTELIVVAVVPNR
jgi:hypothetical protein